MSPEGIKTTRREFHAIAESLADCGESSRPISVAITEIQSARMWLGEALAESGFTNPYKDSLNPTNEKVAPLADEAEDPYRPPSGSHIKYIKEIRVELVRLSEKIRQEVITGSNKQFYRLAVTSAYVAATNARMWLGKELDRVS